MSLEPGISTASPFTGEALESGLYRAKLQWNHALLPKHAFGMSVDFKRWRPSVMSVAPLPSHSDAVDLATGRLRPLTASERQARSLALGKALAEIATITDATDTDEVWTEVMRGIDENRGHRPLFEEAYF